MADVRVIHGDMLAVLPALDAESIDACVTDPPYHLTSIVKRFGSANHGSEKYAAASNSAYMSRGFMGQTWDGGDIAFRPETWAEVFRVMKPGAHLLAMGGTRTFHRLVCAIEDAGFEVRDTITYMYASGFPKSLNVSVKLNDYRCSCNVAAGEHEKADVVLRDVPDLCGTSNKANGLEEKSEDSLLQQLLPQQDICGSVQGHISEGQSRCNSGSESQSGAARREEPSVEGWRNAEAPEGELQGGALREGSCMGSADGPQGWIRDGAPACDGSDVRVSADEAGMCQPHRQKSSEQQSDQPRTVADEWGPQTRGGWALCGRCGKPRIPEGLGTALKPAAELICLARKPLAERTVAANVLAHGTGALNVDACRVVTGDSTRRNNRADMGYHGGNLADEYTTGSTNGRWPANLCHDGSPEVLAEFAKYGESKSGKDNGARGTGGIWSKSSGVPCGPRHNDTGTAARFFFSAKADAGDRLSSKHPTVKPVDLMRWLVRMVTPPVVMVCEQCDNLQHDNSTTPPCNASPLRDLPETVQASGQPPEASVLFQGLRGKGDATTADPALRTVRGDVQAGSSVAESEVLLKKVREQGDGGETREGIRDDADGIPDDVPAGSPPFNQGGLHYGAPSDYGAGARQAVTSNGSCASFERTEGGQQTGESGGLAEETSRQNPKARAEADNVSALRGENQSIRTCPACGSPLVKRAGVVLDPFAGSGTTGMACLAEGFNAVLVEREAEYVADIKRRIAHVGGEDTPLFSAQPQGLFE